MARRRKMSRKQSKRNFNKGQRSKSKNRKMPTGLARGGTRL